MRSQSQQHTLVGFMFWSKDIDVPLIGPLEDFSPDCIVEMIQDRYAHRADDLLKYRYRIVKLFLNFLLRGASSGL